MDESTVKEENAVHLVDRLEDSEVENTDGGFVSIQSVIVARQALTSIFQHPTSTIRFPAIENRGKCHLEFSIAIRPAAWKRMLEPLVFQVAIQDRNGGEEPVFEERLNPREHEEERCWHSFRLDLGSRLSAPGSRLCFSTRCVGQGNTSFAWAVWGNPLILTTEATPVVSVSKPKKGHFFLITADALRRDYIGCYGGFAKTPAIDALSRDSIRMLDARSHSSTTPGSYASLLCGITPLQHGIHGEWGRLDRRIDSIPGLFAEAGYHTVMAASESELSDPAIGFTAQFADTTPPRGCPTQEGSVTTRALLDKLRVAQRETFFWAQYFDVHPPSIPPEPFASMYYREDPTARRNTYRPEAVREINGSETVAEFSRKIPWLEKGSIDIAVLERLRATAEALGGGIGSHPDLATHLFALAPSYRLNMTPPEFSKWLFTQVDCLERGVVNEDLLSWMKLITEELQLLEKDVLAWLDDVVDYRYPVAQYAGGVSQFDAQLAALVRFLKQHDLYEEATIVLTSPHGELLGEHEIHFHHHALVDQVLNVPLLIKFPRSFQMPSEASLSGVFAASDLLPTLCEAFNLREPDRLSGVSRLSNLKSLDPIPEHVTLASCAYKQMVSATKGEYSLLRALGTHRLGPQWEWMQGESLLNRRIDSNSDSSEKLRDYASEEPGIAKELHEALDRAQEHQPATHDPIRASAQLPLLNVNAVDEELDVSFVVCNYNRCDLLKECLQSLEDTVAGIRYEVIVVDDRSTDGSAEFIRGLGPPHRTICNATRKCFAKNNNLAARIARGRILAFLNNDLLFTPGWFQPMYKAANSIRRLGVLGNVQIIPTSNVIDHVGVAFGQGGGPRNYGQEGIGNSFCSLTEWPAVTAACCMIRREVFFTLGGFDECYINGFEDVDLCLRAKQLGYRNYVANHSRVFHRLHSSSGRFDAELENSKRLLHHWGYETRLYSKVCPPENLATLQRQCRESIRNPFRLLAARNRRRTFVSALRALGRFYLKRSLYNTFYAYPGLFRGRLRSRLARA